MKRTYPLSAEKSVRIDSRTIILVKREIPDDIARKNYLENQTRSFQLTQRCGIMKPRSKKKEPDEIELPDVEKEVIDEEEEE